MKKLCLMCWKVLWEIPNGINHEYLDGECCDFCNGIRYGDTRNIQRVMVQIAEGQIGLNDGTR